MLQKLIFNAIHLLTGIITFASSHCYHSLYCGQVNTDLFRTGICTQYFWTISFEKKHIDILILCNGWDGLGIRSPTLIQGKGTFAFTVVDDLVEWCRIWIPNNLFVFDSTLPLLYPQHRAQSANYLSPIPDSTNIINTTTGYKMYWDHCKQHINEHSNLLKLHQVTPTIKVFKQHFIQYMHLTVMNMTSAFHVNAHWRQKLQFLRNIWSTLQLPQLLCFQITVSHHRMSTIHHKVIPN